MGTENLGKRLGKKKVERQRQAGARAHAASEEVQKAVSDRRTAKVGQEVDKDIREMQGKRSMGDVVDQDIAKLKRRKGDT